MSSWGIVAKNIIDLVAKPEKSVGCWLGPDSSLELLQPGKGTNFPPVAKLEWYVVFTSLVPDSGLPPNKNMCPPK